MSSDLAVESFSHSCPDGWKVVPLESVVYFQEGPGILAKDFREGGVPLLRLKGVERDVVTLEGCNFLDPQMVAKKWSHFRVDVGDLLISTSASLGRVSEVTKVSAGAIPYTGLIRFRSTSPDLTRAYLKVFLGSSAFSRQAEAMASGSVIKHFGPSHIRQMAILLPPKEQQLAIGQLASMLEDQIRLLRETNATLEGIAQAIFKSWFIDFDPVKAKSEGRIPDGIDEATAALFPDSFEGSALGSIPKGWSKSALDRVANYLNGLALQKYPPTGNDDLPVIKIAQLRKGDSVGADLAASTIKPEYVVQDGDVLFSWSGSLEVELWCGGRGALNQHLFKVTSTAFPKWFYFLWTRHHLAHFRQVAASKATTMGHIQRAHLSDATVVVPDAEVLDAADQVLGPIIEMIIANSLEAKTLAELRDTLLPRLISGKLKLPELQEVAEAL
jgi:type I restriction enzyme S subunit